MKPIFFALILLIVMMQSFQGVDSKIWKRRHHHQNHNFDNSVDSKVNTEEKREREVNTVPMNNGVPRRNFETAGSERHFSILSHGKAVEPCKEGHRRDGAGVCRPIWNK